MKGQPWARKGREAALAAQLFQSMDVQQNPQRLKQDSQ